MTSRTTERFRKALARLPEEVQRQAREAYRQFRQEPFHPGLRFRQIHPTESIYSARISLNYRAVGVRVTVSTSGVGETLTEENQRRNEDEIIWFWIGSHADYDKLLEQF